MKRNLLVVLLTIVLLPFAINAQNYVGSTACQNCHSGQTTDWKKSGHPYKLQKIVNAVPPVFPAGLSAQKTIGTAVNYTLFPGIPKAPKGYAWNQIGWVLGGYHSNARFIDTAGYIIWGDSTQFNLPTQKWVTYIQAAPGRTAYTFSCYKCHTTGPSTIKTTPFLPFPGIEGSWAEAGVGCEACHGPSSAHVANITIKPPKEGLNTCNNCHARDRDPALAWNLRVEWTATTVSGVPTGFIRHREQGDMMFASRHGQLGFTCVTCHSPHKSVIYNLGGIKPTATCESCHPNKQIAGHGDALAKCVDCHMPFAGRNSNAFTPFVAEQSSHFWKVNTSTQNMRDNLDTTVVAGRFFFKRDANNRSSLTLDYTCLQCHTTKTIAWANQYAPQMHERIISTKENVSGPSAYTLTQNYPNPFNPSTLIKFALPQTTKVTLKVYSTTGQLVQTLIDGEMNNGWHEVKFDGKNFASGVYIYRIQTSDFSYSRKMILNK